MSVPDYPFYVSVADDKELAHLVKYMRKRGFSMSGTYYKGYVCDPSKSKQLFGDDSPIERLNTPNYYKGCRVNCPVTRWILPPEQEVHKELCL